MAGYRARFFKADGKKSRRTFVGGLQQAINTLKVDWEDLCEEEIKS